MRVLGLLLAAFATRAAASKDTTPVPPTQYTTAHGACECEGHCIITTKEECETAAVQIGLPSGDNEANTISTPNAVRGCSVNNIGGLRINTDLTSSWIHRDGRVKGDFRLTVCKECASPFTPPAGCHTTEAPTTEEPTTEEPTTEAPTTAAPTTTCPFVTARGLCECEGYHTLETPEACEAAAASIAHTDLTANVISSLEVAAGCAINRNGGLRFNPDFTSTVIHPAKDARVVLCSACIEGATTPAHAASLCPQSTTEAPTTAAAAPYALVDDMCDGTLYCPLNSASDCDTGAAYVGVSDTTHEEVDRPNKVPGCFFAFNNLVYNPTGDPNSVHEPNVFTDQICGLCANVKLGFNSVEGDSKTAIEKQQWWVYVVVVAAVVVVVAIVVVAVVVSRKRSQKTAAVAPEGSMTVVDGDTIAI